MFFEWAADRNKNLERNANFYLLTQFLTWLTEVPESQPQDFYGDLISVLAQS